MEALALTVRAACCLLVSAHSLAVGAEVGSFTCDCTPNFSGVFCENRASGPVDACALQPCANGGICQRTAAAGGFSCQCPPLFTGPQCQFNATIAGAASSPCRNACSGHGVCVTANGTSQCECEFGFLLSDCSLPAPLALCPDTEFCMAWAYDATTVHMQLTANASGKTRRRVPLPRAHALSVGWFGLIAGGEPSDPLRGDMWLFVPNRVTGTDRMTAIDAWAQGQSKISTPSALSPSDLSVSCSGCASKR
jgi:hypothetical protein